MEELRTFARIVDAGAEDCLVVDTSGFYFLNWEFALRRGGNAMKKNRGPVVRFSGPRRDLVQTGGRDYALVGEPWFRRARIPTANRPSVNSGRAPGSGTFTGGPS
jgi:hypothetical protein